MKKSLLIFIVFVFLIFALPLKTLDTWMLTDVRLDVGDTAGTNNSYEVEIACHETNVYAVWTDDRNGSGDIYFNYSGDGGVTWNWTDFRLDTGDTPGNDISSQPQIASSGSYVYVVWRDQRNGFYDIYFNYSTDYGANWQSPDIRLDTGDTAGANESDNQQIACSGSNVYVTWRDYRNGTATDIYFNSSTDYGANWQSSAIRLDTGDMAGANNSRDPQIASSGNLVYVVWKDNRNGSYDIYFNHSINQGVGWQSLPTRLDVGDTAGANNSSNPQITCSGSNVYVTWQDERNGTVTDIYFNYSTDYGANWNWTDFRLDTGDTPGSNYSDYPEIACSGNYVYVAWMDSRNGSQDIYFNYSANSGVIWQPSALRLDTGDTPGANFSHFPQIACSGNHVYATWYDFRNGSADIYFNFSTDYGASWQPVDIRLDTGDLPGDNDSGDPRIACYETNVYVVWADGRNGNADIYYNRRSIPGTDIKANSSDGPISIIQSDTLQIKISLATYGSTSNVDYWLAYKGPSGWIHFNNTTKKWESGLGVTHQGPLMDLNNKKVFQSSGLAPGNYTFYFGVDMVMDGKVTKSSLYKDEVQVTVTQ